MLSAVERTDLCNFLQSERDGVPLSTAQGASEIPFQRWYKFKEAFSPKFVADVIAASPVPVRRLADPFGGSGTTALTAQFHGIKPVTVEVNPFLADVIETKLVRYDRKEIAAAWTRVKRCARAIRPQLDNLYREAPITLCEPGSNGRWIFDAPILRRIAQFRLAIEEESDQAIGRLFKVLLASNLVAHSNVVVNGKGRRYRGGWRDLRRDSAIVDEMLERQVRMAIHDIVRFPDRPTWDYRLIRGDVRAVTRELPECDLAVFSPPYPNSFDYTDIYNLELWVLGYLKTKADNRKLREATLRSHVQIKRDFGQAPDSPTLVKTLARLQKRSDDLWNADIPAMLGGYFSDMRTILVNLNKKLVRRGQVVIVVGNSKYAGVHVDVTAILTEIAQHEGFRLLRSENIRSMRSSAQQGGGRELDETALWLSKQ